MPTTSFQDLIVWQKGMDLTAEAYRLSYKFPRHEQYRLVSQLTRAASSVPANIAEGKGRRSTREFAQFVSISRGSLMECHTFLLLAIRLEYITASESDSAIRLCEEIGRMLSVLMDRLSQPSNSSTRPR